VDAILDRPDWQEKVGRQLEAPDRRAFLTAAAAAKTLGIDPWEHYFERVRRGEGYWWHVMQADDVRRIDRVIRFAEATLPLAELSSGPRDELGVGPGFGVHHTLEFVVAGLGRFPGRGWTLLRAALRSPVTRIRNMALRALAGWPRESWPAGAEALLRQVVDEEPNEKTLATARRLLD
jgi:hypothetical protein